jgi:hypothetical protein
MYERTLMKNAHINKGCYIDLSRLDKSSQNFMAAAFLLLMILSQEFRRDEATWLI